MGSVLVISIFLLVSVFLGCVNCRRPDVVTIGAVLTKNSVIGRVAKVAIEAAVADVNANLSVLGGTKLSLIMKDSNCSAFIGSIGAFQVLEKDAVAIIGPQSSAAAHMISFIANGLQVPIISFAATDPTLSALQFPFFVRSTPGDANQMTAMADLIGYYEWRQVNAIFIDDDYGRNGISYLEDALAKKMSRISYKIALPVRANRNDIAGWLDKSKVFGPRVYVVHASPDSGLKIFSIAEQLQMMTKDYAWLATEWLCTVLDSSVDSLPTGHNSLDFLQGVVGFQRYIPESDEKKKFVSQWSDLRRKKIVSSELNSYGLYAYDTVWAVAHAINEFLKEGGNISFSSNTIIHDMQGMNLQLGKLKRFDGGKLLVQKLLQMNFTGLTGPIQFDSDRNLIGGSYKVVNFNHSGIRGIGHWTNYSGFSLLAPETIDKTQHDSFRDNQKLDSVTWPGGTEKKPRGWVLADKDRPMRIGVPRRVSYVEFATVMDDNHTIKGFCIDVFEAAMKLIPYDVPYKFVPFGDGWRNPSYDGLVSKVAADAIDGVVGDITITTNRTRIVDFTQPYIATGLVVVTPIRNSKLSAWFFLQPFTVEMWCVTGSFFVLIGVVIWILEHRLNDGFRGSPKRQCITIFLFSFSTLFKTNQENTVSTLGRMVMMVWLFLLMVITSSYTASLTSILTVQQLSSPVNGIDSLIASNEPIGYQVGSFARSYLIDSLNIHESRLVELNSPEEYERALQQGPKNGGVGGIVDELPYVELFLAKRGKFGIVGEMFTKSGWGFAFQRESPFAIDLSTAILKLSENGELQSIYRRWFCKYGCVAGRRHGDKPDQLILRSFWGLFLICGIATTVAFIVYLIRAIRQFVRYNQKQRGPSTSVGCSQVVYGFFNFIDEREEAIKKMFMQCENQQPQVQQGR